MAQNYQALAAEGEIGVASLYEAAGKIGALPSAIKPLTPNFRLFGPAFPVQSPPADNLWLHRAIYEAEPGDILIVHVGDHYEAGYWGEVMTTAALSRKLGGLVIDGGVRDSQRLVEVGFPVFSRTICIRGTAKDPKGEGSLGAPVRFGDVVVHRGDLVVGDADGVVIIPAEVAEEFVKKAHAREAHEAQVMEKLRNGERTLDLFNLK
ncbi:MAG: 4-hydroxy-4-methyl-2-oxoglutarate aldolase [Chloroflexi bacterium]|nr:4-hydroxy-4-methyl-2-oxoglutarate aldolase [Chloroflexota bacterium]OJV94055.1 MAG: 4-hydroxy-4-methyl-2-oxoglutarate aldolase [Chloroflexi bacterium 54-19]